jgi:PLP dependent protein
VEPEDIVTGHGAGANDVAIRIARVRARIAAAEQRFARTPESVTLLAVSKLQGTDKIQVAADAGQTAFGESYVQEAIAKMDALTDLALEWHFIGRIQSNKTHLIAERFSCVHSLYDLRHARRLSDQRPSDLPPLKVFCQVNLSGEPTKGGLPPELVGDFIAACRGLPRLTIVGLMTLPAQADGLEAQRAPFRALRLLRERIATSSCPLPALSMGMTDDLEAAIAEGATVVRVGTALFGPRPPG